MMSSDGSGVMSAHPAGQPVADAHLVVHDLCKSFGAVQAVRSANLTVNRGEVTAIVGDNGAGKSTLIKCVGGVLTADSGYFLVNGHRTNIGSVDEAKALGIETVHQDLALVDDLAVYQNLFLNRELTRSFGPLRALDRRAMRDETDQLLARLGVVVPSVNARVRDLSGGQRQAVAIARGVHWGHHLVILDEPTAALGVRETERVEHLVRELVGAGTSVIMISHNVEQVMRLSSVVWVMRRGEVVGSVRTASSSAAEVVSLIVGAN
jgi:ABC-type sugar transport system ATPase subunit